MSKKAVIVLILAVLLIVGVFFTYYMRANDNSIDIGVGENPTSQVEEKDLYVIRDNGRYGYIDKMGFVVIKPQFEDAYNFSENLARITVHHKYGFIDKSGKVVIEPVFDDAGDYAEGFARVAIDNKYGFIDRSGKVVVPMKYELVNDFSEGMAAVYNSGKWGFINGKGETVIQPRFSNVGFFRKGLAPASEDRLYGYINSKGQYAIKPAYHYANSFSEDMAVVGINNMFGYINAKGVVVIKPSYKSAFDFSEGLAAVVKGDKWGYIDKKGNLAIKAVYETADGFSEGRAAVYDGKSWGYIDAKGTMLIKPQFSYAEKFHKGLAQVRIDDVLSYIDRAGNMIWHEVEEVEIHGSDDILGRIIKMKIQGDQFDLVIKYPHVVDMKDKELQSRINEILRKQSGTEYKGQAGETFRQDYDVMTNKEGIVSILNNSYMYMQGAAHGMSMRSAINMDMSDGKLYALKDLFKAGADYKGRLDKVVKKKLAEDNIPLLREFEGINDKQEYYLMDSELVIYYQLYDYTPYAYGFLEFYIPYESISDIIDRNGPIGKIMKLK